jgi:hypothetical protein
MSFSGETTVKFVLVRNIGVRTRNIGVRTTLNYLIPPSELSTPRNYQGQNKVNRNIGVMNIGVRTTLNYLIPPSELSTRGH